MDRHVIQAAAVGLSLALCSPASAQEADKLNVLGTEMAIKVDGESTGGAMAVIEATVPAKHGPPLHIHSREDEMFYVIDGQFRIVHGEHSMEVSSGEVAFLPRNMRHTYQNIGDGAGRLLVTITPAGLEGFFRKVSERDLSAPQDMEELQALAKEYGLEFVGPPLGAPN
jgi:quercetin dioxygenase-like cupin family protein